MKVPRRLPKRCLNSRVNLNDEQRTRITNGRDVTTAEHNRFEYSPIINRDIIRWPNGARVALWVIPNIEHYEFDRPGMCIAPLGNLNPDVLNYGWRDYGVRVGVWRMMDILDKHNIRATVALNSAVCEYYPQIIEEGGKRAWEFMGHGVTNSRLLTLLSAEEERQNIVTTIRQITEAVGKRPEGWLGPGLSETHDTLDVLAEEGMRYVCDWCNDDQPYLMKVKTGRILSIPYSIEINDIPAFFTFHLTPEGFGEMIKDQFDVLYEEGARSGRVMAIALHPFITGLPFRAKHLDKALEYITSREDVWLATGSEIADWYDERYVRVKS